MSSNTRSKALVLPSVTLSEHEGVRYLHLGSVWIQGGMRISKPQVVEIDYVQRMLASLLWLPTSSLGKGVVCSWVWAPVRSHASRRIN